MINYSLFITRLIDEIRLVVLYHSQAGNIGLAPEILDSNNCKKMGDAFFKSEKVNKVIEISEKTIKRAKAFRPFPHVVLR